MLLERTCRGGNREPSHPYAILQVHRKLARWIDTSLFGPSDIHRFAEITMATVRTSHTHPLQIAEVRASSAHGRIGITFCPGKHDHFAHTGAWERYLGIDLDMIAAWGAKLVLTLVE